MNNIQYFGNSASNCNFILCRNFNHNSVLSGDGKTSGRKEKHFIEEQQVHSIQERMEEVEQFYNGIRQMKHEMRNHLTNIKGLMESGNYEDMQQYLSKWMRV